MGLGVIFEQRVKPFRFFLAPGLRPWREKRGISLRRFASLLGYSPAYISDVERGNRRASKEFIKRFKGVFWSAKR